MYHAVRDVVVQLGSRTELRHCCLPRCFGMFGCSCWGSETELRKLLSTMAPVMTSLLSRFGAHEIEEIFHDSVCGGFSNLIQMT